MKMHSRNNSNKSVEHYVLTTKKIEHHTNRCSSESQLKLGSGLLDFRTTQPKIQFVAETEHQVNCLFCGLQQHATQIQKPSLEVTPVLLIYSFQQWSGFPPRCQKWFCQFLYSFTFSQKKEHFPPVIMNVIHEPDLNI